MLNPKKGNLSHNLDNITLPTANGVPKMTSTPLNPRHAQLSRRSSVLLSPTKSKLINPRRYSLSDMNPSINKSNPQETRSPGPLLASLSYKDNVSMYEETKSSGLARRIVLYSEEAEQERPPTHQEKYHSPGLFPIVHLFKKKPPFLVQSPKRVKIKLSSPDYLSHSPQHRSKLLEGLARPRLQRQHNLSSSSHTSSGKDTKSVLDALKEISRKRIHPNEECDLEEDSGKRIRTELHNGVTTKSKRNRADSPQSDSSESSPPKQTPKKFCVYDEFAASKSSADFSFLNKIEPARSKRKTISTSTESLKETKQVKLINAETQTILSSSESKTKSNDVDENDSQKMKRTESPLKVFDDAPLDRIRKNRLAALMGNLAGKDATLLPKPTTVNKLASEASESKELEETPKSMENSKEAVTIFSPPPVIKEVVTIFAPPPFITENDNKNETDLVNMPLISILSPPKTTKELSPVRLGKHVHFNLPGTTLSSTLLTQTSASVVTPIVSASISNSLISKNTEGPFGSVDLKAKSLAAPSSTPSFSFGNISSSKSDTHISNTVNTNGNVTSPSFNFSKSAEASKRDTFNVPKLIFEAPKTSSPQKSGGFKFDLKTPSTADLGSLPASKSETPTLTFSNSSVSATCSTASLGSVDSTTFTFAKPNEPTKDGTFKFETSSFASKGTLEPTFKPFNNITPETKLPSFNSTATSGFNFSSTGNAPRSGDSSVKFTTFGTTTTTATTSSKFTTLGKFSFTQGPVNTTTSAVFAFGGGAVTTSSSGFGSKPTPSFETNSTLAPSFAKFGNSAAAPVSGFGNNPTTTTFVFGNVTTTSNSGFGRTPVPSFGNTSVTSTPIFGNIPNNSMSDFSTTPVTTTVPFGSTPAPTAGFGNASVTSTSVFGGTPVTSTSVFGSTPVTTTSVFGSTNTSTTSGFGIVAPTTSQVFGGVNNSTFGLNQTTTAPIFGSSNTKPAAFGSSSVFGASNTPAPTFGSNTAPNFENSSQPKPMFGAPSTTTSNTSSTFGSNTFGSTTTANSTTSAPFFGVSNTNSTFTFGSNKPATNVFGSVTTASANTFGSNTFSSTGGFDQSSGYGNNTSAFGSSTMPSNTFGSSATPSNTFGATNTPAFGQVENKPTFAFGGSADNKTNSVFGSGAGNSAFGKPILNTQGGFGSSTGGFGSTNTSGFSSAQQTNGGFNFGSNAAPSSSAPFAFGVNSGSAETPKPTFNFTGGSSNPPAFGANSNTPAFGSSNPNFGTPTFGATGAPAAGVFNIGAGSNTGRPRTQLRAKRRT